MKLEYSRQMFEEHMNIKFHNSPSSGSRVVQHGRRERDTDMTKLTVAHRNFTNAPQNADELIAAEGRTSEPTIQS